MDEPVKGQHDYKKIMKQFENAVFWFLALVILVTSALLLQSAVKNESPKVFQYTLYTVDSGSMTPTLPIGSVIFVEKVLADSLNTGDIILFQIGSNLPVTHRIVRIATQDDLAFITQGDANAVVDPLPIAAENVIGRVSYVIPWTASILWVIKNPLLLILLSGAAVFVLFVWEIYKIAQNKRKHIQSEKGQT